VKEGSINVHVTSVNEVVLAFCSDAVVRMVMNIVVVVVIVVAVSFMIVFIIDSDEGFFD
jgi:hypothetical protein